MLTINSASDSMTASKLLAGIITTHLVLAMARSVSNLDYSNLSDYRRADQFCSNQLVLRDAGIYGGRGAVGLNERRVQIPSWRRVDGRVLEGRL